MMSSRSIIPTLGVLTVFALAAACKNGDESAVKGRNGPNGAAKDSVSELALTEDGLGQVQVGMTLDEAVSLGLLSENPTMNAKCDYVFPAVGAGIPEGVSVMVVRGKIARIDVDTGSVTTEEGARIGDTEDRIKSIYGDDLQIQPHKYITGGHYMIVPGDSASAGKAIVFETDGQHVTMFRSGRQPEVQWVEGCS
ncbi:MAG TPA: hypothetical protein VM166_07655 [Gemmatimonadaceae bacterium]|nr:hypothetical protein [Gemmatimonadaceae bacterium]